LTFLLFIDYNYIKVWVGDGMKKEISIPILENILENIDEGIHYVDKECITQIYNHNMEKIEGMNRKLVLGKNFRTIFKDIPEEDSTLLKALKGITINDNVQRYLNKNGKEIIALNTTLPIKLNGEIIGALEISKDITKIKNLSDELIKLQTMDKEIKERDIGIKRRNYEFDDIIGDSPKIKRAIELAKKAAESDATIFIYGETGTGKELLSQAIHYKSARKNAPFLAINCATLPESLFEAILFGTEKGGFTGAENKIGLFEQANGGTLLLDEINSLPTELQAKLLRVLQEKTIRRIGGTKDIPVDVRIISTTNENPKEIIKTGKMRLDLYYRLNLIFLELPPLRERKDDILLLSKKFLTRYNKKFNKNVKGLTKEVEEIFTQYLWPGNIRELENVIESSMILTDNTYLTKDFLNIYWDDDLFVKKPQKEGKAIFVNIVPENKSTENDSGLLTNLISKMEEKYIREAIDSFPYNLSKAAAYLGISRQALQYKMKKYNIKY